VSEDTVTFDFLKKEDKYFSGSVVPGMKKEGWMRFDKNFIKRGEVNIWDMSGDG
jgi:hypothetical protein